jgi:hypothetical protein
MVVLIARPVALAWPHGRDRGDGRSQMAAIRPHSPYRCGAHRQETAAVLRSYTMFNGVTFSSGVSENTQFCDWHNEQIFFLENWQKINSA